MKKTNTMIIAGREVHIRPEKYYWSDFFLALPAVLLLVLITYYPIAALIRISFTDWRLTMTTAPEYVGWKNWSWLFTAKTSLRYLGNSLKVTLVYTIFNIAIDLGIGLILAHLFNRLTKPFALMRALVFMPRYIAMSSCGIIFLWMLNTDYGVINILLERVGVKNHLNWLGDDNLALVSILLLTGWHGVHCWAYPGITTKLRHWTAPQACSSSAISRCRCCPPLRCSCSSPPSSVP